MTQRDFAEAAWADLTLARRVLEDARRAEAAAAENRRHAEQQVEYAEGTWREALAAGGSESA
jgi:hypothetical protein